MRYTRHTKADLVVFANNRQLTVQSSLTNGRKGRKGCKGPFHRDYVRALEDADRNATFRFLDLPPELRTWVYDELLILNNSFTCCPQILRTCQQIRNEATNTLYGHNLIEIKVKEDGVYAHNKRCGIFNPSSPDLELSHHITLQWPDFLHRAQFIHITLMPRKWLWATSQTRARFSEASKMMIAGNITYSFCASLSGKHRLRDVQLGLGTLTGNDRAFRHILDPFRLLGMSIFNRISRNALVPASFDQDASINFSTWGAWNKFRHIRTCNALASQVLLAEQPNIGILDKLLRSAEVVMLNTALSVNTAKDMLLTCTINDLGSPNVFNTALDRAACRLRFFFWLATRDGRVNETLVKRFYTHCGQEIDSKVLAHPE